MQTKKSYFSNKKFTLEGLERAQVKMISLKTLWFNTGTLCNLSCENCYIESSPKNDSLVYLTLEEVKRFLNEINVLGLNTSQIGFTGGEPFMNPHIISMLKESLKQDKNILILTNAMRPMMRFEKDLLNLKKFCKKIFFRVSLDHFTQANHERIRGKNTWEPTIRGIKWLYNNGFSVSIASRMVWNQSEQFTRENFNNLFQNIQVQINAYSPNQLVLFPELNSNLDTPEITNKCWKILNKRPEDMMCSSSRMIIRRKDSLEASVLPCTLLTDDSKFEIGKDLKSSKKKVYLNHPHCSKFCVLGGGSCSPN